MPEKNRSNSHRAVELIDTLHRLGGSARTRHLASVLDVSDETIRRITKKLSKEGLITRVHGGVFLVSEARADGFQSRLGQNRAAKREIAKTAAKLVRDGMSLFMDVSSSTAYVAEALRKRKDLVIVTNSLAAAQILSGRNGNRVYLAGGEVSARVNGCFGSSVSEFVSRFQADLAFLGADGIDATRGFMLDDVDEAGLAGLFANRARRPVMVADHGKFRHSAPALACDPATIAALVTDQIPAAAMVEALVGWGIDLHISNDAGGGA